MHSSLFHFLFRVAQAELEPISIYHPMIEEIFAAIGAPMEGFLDGADVVTEAMATAAAQAVPTETLIPSVKPVPVDEATHIERVSESAPHSYRDSYPLKGSYSSCCFPN